MDFGYSGETLWNPMSSGWNQEQSSAQSYMNQPPQSANPSSGQYPCAPSHSNNVLNGLPLQNPASLADPSGITEDTPKEKTKKRFSRAAVQILEDYVMQNIENPFPTESEKDKLAELAGITKCQVSTWFTNTRRRRWKNLKEEVKETRNPRRKLHISPRKPLAPLQTNVNCSYQGTPTYPSHPYNIYPTPPSAIQPSPMVYSNPSAMSIPAHYPVQTSYPVQPALYNPNYQPAFNTLSPAYPSFDASLQNDSCLYGSNSNFYY